MEPLDSVDMRILQVLQADGRLPLTQVSEQLDIPHATLRDRIHKLEKAGVIEGYCARINPARLGFVVNGFVEIVLDHRIETDRAVAALLNIEEVTEVHLLTGETDVMVRIWAKDVEHLRTILYDKFTSVPGLVRTNTLVVLNTWSKPLPLETAGQASPGLADAEKKTKDTKNA